MEVPNNCIIVYLYTTRFILFRETLDISYTSLGYTVMKDGITQLSLSCYNPLIVVC